MNIEEHLLTILSEECNEVAHRASKALRFGLAEKQIGQEMTNAERIAYEFSDLLAMYQELHERGLLPVIPPSNKPTKVSKYLAYSKACGTLTD